MDNIFKQATNKAEILRCASIIGDVADSRGEHVTDGCVEYEDDWYKMVGHAFYKLIQDKDFARLVTDNCKEFIFKTDSNNIGAVHQEEDDKKDEETYLHNICSIDVACEEFLRFLYKRVDDPNYQLSKSDFKNWLDDYRFALEHPLNNISNYGSKD